MTSSDTPGSAYQPQLLSVLRIVAGLLFLQHGLMKLFAFPGPFMRPVVTGELIWFAGLIEVVGGVLLVLGLFTRWTAFLCSGLMAAADFIGHAGRGFYPILNGGNLSILYCFVFLYLFAAGPGPWSVDAKQAAPESDAAVTLDRPRTSRFAHQGARGRSALESVFRNATRLARSRAASRIGCASSLASDGRRCRRPA